MIMYSMYMCEMAWIPLLKYFLQVKNVFLSICRMDYKIRTILHVSPIGYPKHCYRHWGDTGTQQNMTMQA